MNTYMLILHDDIKGYESYSRDELKELIGKMSDWAQDLRAKNIHQGSNKLADEPAEYVRYVDDQFIVDGPHTEAKELLGGYFLIHAADKKGAIEIAKGCPAVRYASKVEVRTVHNVCEGVLERARD